MSKSIIFIIIFFSFLHVRAEKPLTKEAVEVTIATVIMSELFDSYNIVGECRNENSRDFYANVSGKLKMVSENQGQYIKKGEVLLVIDHDIALNSKGQAEAALKFAADSYIRDQALFKKKFISLQELERSQADLENAKLNFSKSLKTYNDMLITAPFNGTMGVVAPKIEDDIKQGDYLFSLIGDGGLQSIFIELPESLHGEVSNSTEAKVKFKENQIEGKISSISPYISNNGTLNAKIIIPANQKILHGSFVDIELIINKHKNLAVPQQSVQRNNQGNFIYKIIDNTAKQIFVKTGVRTNNLIEITSSELHEGDIVILDGFTKIDNDSLVKVKP